MLNCHKLVFSESQSEKRTALASTVLGVKLVKRIIGLALYLLGASRKSIAESIDMPYETFKSFTCRIEKNGASGLIDRRGKPVYSLPHNKEKTAGVTVSIVENSCIINLNEENDSVAIPIKNTLQLKVFLLSMLRNKIIPADNVAEILNYTKSYTLKLAENLNNMDMSILEDQRRGQKTDYVFTPEIKSEVIIQTAGNAVVGKSTSSKVIADDIERRTGTKLSERTVRQHASELGLKDISKKLTGVIDSLKKNWKP